MGMFSDDFPFTRREAEVEAAAGTPTPTVEAQPLAADAFADDFPFSRRESEAPAAPAPARPAAAPSRFRPASSIFPPGFPFVEPQPEVVPVLEAAPAVTAAPAASAAHADAIAPSLDAPIPAPAASAPLPFKDRRRSPRQRMSAKATLRVDTVGGNPLTVQIDNLSLLGVRLRADRELLVNDKANIRLEVGPLKWASRLRVINCIRHDATRYTIGCEFIGNELARGRVAA